MLARALLISIFASACAVNNPLARRMQPRKEREYHVHEFGLGMSPSNKEAYESGNVIPGMLRSYVFDLLGEPDQQLVDSSTTWLDGRAFPLRETTWIYFSNADTILVVRMIDSSVVEVR